MLESLNISQNWISRQKEVKSNKTTVKNKINTNKIEVAYHITIIIGI